MEAIDNEEGTVFTRAVVRSSPKSLDILKLLLEEIKLREMSKGGVIPQSRVSRHHSRFSQRADLYIKKLLNVSYKNQHMPLVAAAYSGRTDLASLLLASEADTDLPAAESYRPILAACEHDAHGVLRLLLRYGARVDVLNFGSDSLLHTTAYGGGYQTISTLIEHGICCIDTKQLNLEGYTPLEAFEVERPIYRNEDEATRLRCKELFLQLLESIEIKTATVGHDCWKEQLERRAANSRMPTTENSDSSDDEFFDPQSNHGVDMASMEELGPEELGAGNLE